MKFISALFLSVTTFFQGLFGITPPPTTPIVNNQPAALSADSIKISLVPTTNELEIHLLGKNQSTSAIAMRLVYRYTKTPTGAKITPNLELVKDNWMFPVKTAVVNTAQKTVTFDLAAANISTTGFAIGPDVLLAKINLPGLDQNSLSLFSFDPKETKVYSKSTIEIPLIF